MPTPKPVAPDGDPPENRTVAEQGPSQSLDSGPDDTDTARTDDELPESVPSRSSS